ncbi:MAG: photosystem II reaction center PsbP family protein [Synechococcales cyanobacterium T60_A2020_003]|nr:photosystem II reaction center PsbP family protein [Synechococcales cyanobacterium T60_A2020_003]
MIKRVWAIVLLVIVGFGLQSCSSLGASFNSYVDNYDGYQFLYPTGWVEYSKATDGPDVVFHDIIQETENVSVVMSPVPEAKTLSDLGTPTEIGQRIAQKVLTSDAADRKAELVSAAQREVDGSTYYLLEYEVNLPGQKRHNLASAVVRRGQLYTFNASTTEDRWERMKDTFKQVVSSFSVY